MDLDALIELDRQLLLWLNGSESLYLDALVHILTTAATWIPLYLALFYVVVKNSDTVTQILLVLACAGLCALMAGAVDDLIVKPTIARWRPTHDPVIGTLVDTVNGYRGGSYGFFSAHASNTFSIAVFFSLLIRSRLLTVALVLWSFVNCWTRLYLGVHFPGDIVCGLLWGALTGTVVYLLYVRVCRRLYGQHRYFSDGYTRSGFDRNDIHVVISVLVFTLIYALLRSCLMLYM